MTNQFEKITVSRTEYKNQVAAAKKAEARKNAINVLKKPVWIVTIAVGVTAFSLGGHPVKAAEVPTTSQQNVQEVQFEYNESYVYTIKPGDTVESLAKSHGVSVQQLRDHNALTSDKLVPGTEIELPDLNNPYNEGSPLHKYVVKNNQSSQTTVKTPVIKETVKPVTKPVTQAPTKPANYKVQGGETLFKIAKKFNISVDALKKANNLTSDHLSIGQGLYVPLKPVSSTPKATTKPVSKPVVQKPTSTPVKQTTSSTTSTIKKQPVSTSGSYVVKSGDNLWKIARTYGVTVEALKKVNHLTTNTLYIGEKLVLPGNKVSANTSTPVSVPKTKEQVATKEAHVSSITYAVQPGDTIWTLSQRFGISKEKIKRDNGLKSDVLIIKQQVQLKDINIQQVTGTVIGPYDKDDRNFIALNVNGKTKVIRVSFKQTQFFEKISGEKITLRYVPKSNTVKDDAFVNFNFAK